jgi:hypothetical protein
VNPLFIVAGIAIAAGTAAWLFDSATEDEERRHEQLRQQINELNAQLGEFDIKLETLQQEHLKKRLANCWRNFPGIIVRFTKKLIRSKRAQNITGKYSYGIRKRNA